jgi:hypothetical protein
MIPEDQRRASLAKEACEQLSREAGVVETSGQEVFGEPFRAHRETLSGRRFQKSVFEICA